MRRNELSVLRNDLKSYETEGTDVVCSSENRENSTRIQVNLARLWPLFQCMHHPSRARSTISQDMIPPGADQVRFVQ
ncbi:hypothetical protein HG66A1_31500 [Gimesia chilikensis]|uniref:Uncharacterized protein n=1 Tax=Gimesia chilikensis TaxID=2605989 RepID=A0A517PPP7_9PLAN|nr:hypothetical protein HG66A1_31500 [Gimesia chilikensis]